MTLREWLNLTPHSPEWFEALVGFDTTKAQHTAAIIRAAKSQEVCSICGDTPFSEMICWSLGAPSLVPIPLTFRLCDDCLNIRRADDEVWLPAKAVPIDEKWFSIVY